MVPRFESTGLIFTGKDKTNQRMGIVELHIHPFYIGAQFHPEYKSRPGKTSPLFLGLLSFCERLEAEKGYEVEEHMDASGIVLEEAEISAFLKVSAATGRENKVYRYLHKLRECVGCVSEETSKMIEEWFYGEKASKFSDNGICSEIELLRAAFFKIAGGWHGLGWVGEGKWIVKKCSVSPVGKCLSCGEHLACVDTNEAETEKFVDSLVALACVDSNLRPNCMCVGD